VRAHRAPKRGRPPEVAEGRRLCPSVSVRAAQIWGHAYRPKDTMIRRMGANPRADRPSRPEETMGPPGSGPSVGVVSRSHGFEH
jgi:hypothetical protein